jgi:predicted benzoate:H+ symporter BenE
MPVVMAMVADVFLQFGLDLELAVESEALLTASGERARHYAAAVWCGVLAIGFGLLTPKWSG